MDEDFEDTVIAPVRRSPGAPIDDDDTILRPRIQLGEPIPFAVLAAQSADFYQFVVNTHEPITLDRPALIGRRPSSPRVLRGELPRLVRVPSPLGEVSSTHLQLSQDGAMVIVTDRWSTNGTIVTIPGSLPVRLRQGESLVVIPGSIVEIGDGNVIEILPIQRARPVESSLPERLS